ncbi:SMP-30/gluconolactonase/LRE family protein (plasmid) [Rhizobium sp. CC1099]|uniref:SMP-30/gluconolactonase/LRE family protein n=1 Tax=Rhizobium sp. CC1099 TaxID=3039160 RepID=UPI0024B084AF|nr:SMP-30/gluconolactonase/LRE family protein [Rhizobium sp. CC1099]WFU91863.1 SMP-30/gluconolactonase/LRE family protein [Rhizobium sp. CC1099]
MLIEPRLFASGLSWPESPRWRDDVLYISDVHNFRVAKIAPNGIVESLCKVEGRPAGMDFSKDGTLLLATGIGRQLLGVDPHSGAIEIKASLPGADKSYLNDLVVHPDGWAYFGETGFRFGVDAPEESGCLWAYHPEKGLKQVAREIFFPNGLVVSPDGATLYVAETFGKRVSAFDISQDGTLKNRRVHANLRGEPDGLSLDADGCLWVPLLFMGEFVRIAPDGSEVDLVKFPGMNAIACIGAGEDRRTLFFCVCKADRSDPTKPVLDGAVYVAASTSQGAGSP